ncbi:MAG: MFS transporter [Acidimicrobiales bacterium]
MDDAGLAELRTARDDLVGERPDGPDRFVLDHGPFEHYQRTLTVTEGTQDHQVTETYQFRLSVPVWRPLFTLIMRRALPRRRNPWWSPPSRLDARAARVLSLLAVLQVIDGYLGTVISQTITFAADEFNRTSTAQGVTLAVVRIGVLVALGVMVLADRHGRRRLLRWAMLGAVLLTGLGALSPGLWFLGGSQLFARGLTTGMGILIGVMAAEELPRGARAYGVSMLSLAAALGAGMAVWVLPVADLNPQGWRVVYLVPLLSLPLVLAACRRLPETRRFVANKQTPDLHGAPLRTEYRRLALLATGAFLFLLFASPASQFQNDFLREQRGFNATGISIYTLLTSTPAAIGIFLAGKWADTRGRRHVGALGLAGGATLITLSYFFAGPLMWASHLGGVVVGSLTVALGVYGPELFSTHHRAKANGTIVTIGVLGSVCGLLLVGWLHNYFGAYGPAFAVVTLGPFLAAWLVISRYPETARKALEELNPDDANLEDV